MLQIVLYFTDKSSGRSSHTLGLNITRSMLVIPFPPSVAAASIYSFRFQLFLVLAGDWVNDDSVTLFYRLRCVHRRRIAYIPNDVGHRIYKFKEENRLESETFTHVTTALSHHGKWRCQLEISKGVARAFYRWDSQYGEISLTMW